MNKPSIEYVKSFLFEILKAKGIDYSFSDSLFDLKIKAGYDADAIVAPFEDADKVPAVLVETAEKVVVSKTTKKDAAEVDTDK